MFKTSFFVMAALGISLAMPVMSADAFSSRSKRNMFAAQSKFLDNRAALQYANSSRLQPPSVNAPDVQRVNLPYRGKYRGEYMDMARKAARRYDIPEDLFLRLVQQESGWNPNAKSHKGALGLAQLMPATARHLRVDPSIPYENLDGGARYLARQFKQFKSWRLALAAYNAGPDAVKKYDGVPPYKETRNYVKIILGS